MILNCPSHSVLWSKINIELVLERNDKVIAESKFQVKFLIQYYD